MRQIANFYFKKIIVSGGGNEPSVLDFTEGLNIICGPSDTGKSYIIECLDFLFGSKKIRINQNSGYDTIKLIVQVVDGGTVTFERKLDTKKIEVGGTEKSIESGAYKVEGSKNNISDVWLSLMGIKETPYIIKNARFEKQRLGIRSFLHAILINESNVFQTEPILVSKHDTQKTASLSALLYLMTGLNYEETSPKEEKKIKEAKKKAVISYINTRLESMAGRIVELDKLTVADIHSLQTKVEEIIDDIAETERQITKAIEQSRLLMTEIYDLNEQLAECNILYNRIQALRTQYNSDIKRLTFIVEGELNKNGLKANEKCPFCDSQITVHHEHSYARASQAEAERIQLQLKDLSETDQDILNERIELMERIDILAEKRSNVDAIVNRELKPRMTGLKQMLADYRRAIEVHNEMEVIHQLENSMKIELNEVVNEEDTSELKFDIKAHFGSSIRSALDEILTRILKKCKYDGFSSVYFNQKEFDVVVNGKLKDSFGKGYRAFLNTVTAMTLMEYLGEHGKFTPGILIVDSPILSLKEKVSDKASDSMKSALFQYLLDHQEHGQVIIVENNIPKLDYDNANVVRFTKDIHHGRYGFLNGVR